MGRLGTGLAAGRDRGRAEPHPALVERDRSLVDSPAGNDLGWLRGGRREQRPHPLGRLRQCQCESAAIDVELAVERGSRKLRRQSRDVDPLECERGLDLGNFDSAQL